MQQQTTETGGKQAVVEREPDWTTWHLHLGTSARSAHDRVIGEVIAPAVDSVPERPWFFLRYWQAGPHLRLRIGDLSTEERRRLDALLEDRLAEAGRPAEDEEPLDREAYTADAARMTHGETGANRFVEELRSPGVHPADYAPETDRYGGVAMMPRTERLFQLSSELVRALLPQASSSARRSLIALRATMAAAAALGDATEQAQYYKHGVRLWSEWAAGYGLGREDLARLCRLDQGMAGVARRFTPDDHGPFAEWHRALAELAEEIRTGTARHPGEIVSSHVHMFHNRLGLPIHEELRTYAWLSQLYPAAEDASP